MQEKNIRQSLRQFYNSVSDKFSQTRQNWWRELNFIRKYQKGKEQILDFGCGNGRLLEFLKTTETENDLSSVETAYMRSLQDRYIGVDISEKLIELAQQKYPDFKFLTIEDERKLPFENEQFDLICAIAVFHHFTPKIAQEALKELKRILKKDGVLVITAWYLWNEKYLKFLIKSNSQGNLGLGADISFDSQKGIYWRFCYWWIKRSLLKVVKKAGLEILEEGYTVDKDQKKRNIYLVAKRNHGTWNT